MTIMGLYGNVGYGKNIFVTKYARRMVQIGEERQETWKEMNERERRETFGGIEPPAVKVKANWHIWDRPHDPEPEVTVTLPMIPPAYQLPNIDYMTIDQFLGLEGEEGVLYHLLIDEPYAWGLEARRSGSDIAVEMTKKSLQSRKTGVRGKQNRQSGSDIFYLTQLPSSMDKRLKFLARAIYLALPPDEFGYHYLYMGKIYRVHHIEMQAAIDDVYPYYDTYEKIQMTFSDDFMRATGGMEAGRQQDDTIMQKALTQVQNDVLMLTADGHRFWKSLTSVQVWEEEMKKGGKIINPGSLKTASEVPPN